MLRHSFTYQLPICFDKHHFLALLREKYLLLETVVIKLVIAIYELEELAHGRQ